MLNLLDQFPRKEITKQTYLYISFFTFILIFRTRVLREVSSESKDIRLLETESLGKVWWHVRYYSSDFLFFSQDDINGSVFPFPFDYFL